MPDIERPDEGMIEIYQDLNQRFYAAKPADYLRTRWMLLGLMAGNRQGVEELFAQGAAFEDIVFSPIQTEVGTSGATTDVAYLITESEALLHHASETLLRLFFAHIEQPPCPWVEIVALRAPRQFKSRTEKLLETSLPMLDRAAGLMFTGNPDSEAGKEYGPVMARLLRAAARQVTERAAVYNSVKHGMSVIPGEVSVWFFGEDPSTRVGGQGPSITILDSENAGDGRRVWSEHTEWIDVRSNLLLASLLIMGVHAIWTVAAASYTGAELPRVLLPTQADADAALLDSRRGHPMVSMRHSLFEQLP